MKKTIALKVLAVIIIIAVILLCGASLLELVYSCS